MFALLKIIQNAANFVLTQASTLLTQTTETPEATTATAPTANHPLQQWRHNASATFHIAADVGHGNCFYGAISDQLERRLGRIYNHEDLRTMANIELRANADHDFIAGDVDAFIEQQSRDGEPVEHAAIIALADVLKIKIIVLSHTTLPVTHREQYRNTVLLGYMGNGDTGHYVSLAGDLSQLKPTLTLPHSAYDIQPWENHQGLTVLTNPQAAAVESNCLYQALSDQLEQRIGTVVSEQSLRAWASSALSSRLGREPSDAFRTDTNPDDDQQILTALARELNTRIVVLKHNRHDPDIFGAENFNTVLLGCRSHETYRHYVSLGGNLASVPALPTLEPIPGIMEAAPTPSTPGQYSVPLISGQTYYSSSPSGYTELPLEYYSRTSGDRPGGCTGLPPEHDNRHIQTQPPFQTRSPTPSTASNAMPMLEVITSSTPQPQQTTAMAPNQP